MSIATWMDEFYPVAARKVLKEESLQHSLRKWEGLLDENLARHGLEKGAYGVITDGRVSFDVDSTSCALCYHHTVFDVECGDCPLVALATFAHEEYACEKEYWAFSVGDDPKPMIALLRKAVELQAV